MAFIQEYKWVILFYSLIILLLFIFRKKFEIHSKFLAMYRTKIGLKLMDRLGAKYAEQIKLLGFIGVGAGYIGLFTILYLLIKNLISLLTIPSATSAVSLVIPGIKIPGSPVTIPLITGWIALFVVILVHEFSHGVVARAHKIPVTSSGIFFAGPLMGAFVEPEEKKLVRQNDTVQYSVFAAGPFSNMLLAFLCIILLTYAFTPGINAMTNDIGVSIVGVTEGYPAKDAGMQGGMVVTAIDNQSVKTYEEFTNQMRHLEPEDEVIVQIQNGTSFTFSAAKSPTDPEQGYLGVMASTRPERELKIDGMYFKILYVIITWIAELVSITGLLSLGIGLANLLPLGPVDGGRMVQVTLQKIRGKEKGNMIWKKISVATLILLVINVLWPLFKWLGKLLV